MKDFYLSSNELFCLCLLLLTLICFHLHLGENEAFLLACAAVKRLSDLNEFTELTLACNFA